MIMISIDNLVFSQHLFWNEHQCRRLCEIAAASSVEDAGVHRDGKLYIDPNFRKTKRILLDQSLFDEIGTSLLWIKPRVEEYFQLPLQGLQGIQFLQYSAGDYFHTHADEFEPPSETSRKISLILFLNSGFQGGDVVLYKDADHYRAKDGFHIIPQEGLLIAFSSYLLHEVEEILTGKRLSLVSWFY
ncbi:MAG TPA: 2OG-Fe(II) oxygenase [Acidobacteriota bacterium]